MDKGKVNILPKTMCGSRSRNTHEEAVRVALGCGPLSTRGAPAAGVRRTTGNIVRDRAAVEEVDRETVAGVPVEDVDTTAVLVVHRTIVAAGLRLNAASLVAGSLGVAVRSQRLVRHGQLAEHFERRLDN